MTDYEKFEKFAKKKRVLYYKNKEYTLFVYCKDDHSVRSVVVPSKQNNRPWWPTIVQIALQIINLLKG